MITAGNIIKKIKFCLVFFYVGPLVSCQIDRGGGTPVVEYSNGKAISVRFHMAGESRPPGIFLAGEEHTPVLGILENKGQLYTFRPHIPFTSGFSYIIRNSTDSIGAFSIREARAASPELTAIYPQLDTVPENLLKCYFQFSEPMQAVGRAADYIEITDLQSGESIDVFLELENELWDKSHSRLTLWLDPGRIKTGLIPNRVRGKPITQGKRYRIKVSGEWRSAMGIPMDQDFFKTIYVGPADKAQPDPGLWHLEVPDENSAEPLKINFDQPVDLLTILDMGRISDRSGNEVPGEWKGLDGSLEMAYFPENPWKKGSYTLHIDPAMEDLAGNTVNRLFDTDLTQGREQMEVVEEISLPFSIGD